MTAFALHLQVFVSTVPSFLREGTDGDAPASVIYSYCLCNYPQDMTVPKARPNLAK